MLDKYNSFLNEIYEAATDFSYWEEIIEKLAETTKSSSSVFLVVNNKKPELTYGEFLINVDPEHRRLYEAGYYNKIDKFSIQLGKLSGKVIHSSEAISNNPELFLQPEVESDFFRKYGYAHRIGFAIPHDDDHHICLYLNRCKKDGDFKSPDEIIHLLELLSPHIKRSMQLAEYMTVKDDLVNSLGNGFSGSTTGIIFLDSSKEIIYINDAAKVLLDTYDHFFNYSKTIALKRNNTKLIEYIENSLLAATSGDATPGGAFSIPGKTPGQYLDILVSPVKLNHLVCTYFKHTRVAIFLSTSNQSLSCQKTLQNLYGLTHAESSILIDFINNPDLNSIAETRSANLHTIRSQIKSIMSKMNVRKQTELVKKVLQGSCRHLINNSNY
ncbi:MAG: hypothetical protein AB2692_22790 [Candidatus Thiodiazotropha sp.]